jgi:hypothetical protein
MQLYLCVFEDSPRLWRSCMNKKFPNSRHQGLDPPTEELRVAKLRWPPGPVNPLFPPAWFHDGVIKSRPASIVYRKS